MNESNTANMASVNSKVVLRVARQLSSLAVSIQCAACPGVITAARLPQGPTCSAAAGFKEGALMGNSFRTALS